MQHRIEQLNAQLTTTTRQLETAVTTLEMERHRPSSDESALSQQLQQLNQSVTQSVDELRLAGVLAVDETIADRTTPSARTRPAANGYNAEADVTARLRSAVSTVLDLWNEHKQLE